MKDNISTGQKTIKDKLLWSLVIALILVGSIAHYYYINIKEFYYYIILGWIVLSLAILSIIYLTSLGKKFIGFCKEAQVELYKVLWPTRKETVQTTFMVMIVVLIMAVILWFLDSLLFLLISYITGQKG